MTYKTEAERREDAPSRGELALQEAVDNANKRAWWSDHNNIHFLMEYLNGPENDTEVIFDVSSALEIIEKPWHFTDEFIKAVEQYVKDTEGDPSAFDYELGKMLGVPRVAPLVDDQAGTAMFPEGFADDDDPYGYTDEDSERGDR